MSLEDVPGVDPKQSLCWGFSGCQQPTGRRNGCSSQAGETLEILMGTYISTSGLQEGTSFFPEDENVEE